MKCNFGAEDLLVVCVVASGTDGSECSRNAGGRVNDRVLFGREFWMHVIRLY